MSTTMYEDVTLEPFTLQNLYYDVFCRLFDELDLGTNTPQGGLFDDSLQPTITCLGNDPHGVHLRIDFKKQTFHVKYHECISGASFDIWDSDPETTSPCKKLLIPRAVVAYIMTLLWRYQLRSNP